MSVFHLIFSPTCCKQSLEIPLFPKKLVLEMTGEAIVCGGAKKMYNALLSVHTFTKDVAIDRDNSPEGKNRHN